MVVAKEEGCNSAKVTELVKSFVRGAEQVTDVGAELSLILPSAATFTFPALFDALEGIYHSTCTIISTDQIGCSIFRSLNSYSLQTTLRLGNVRTSVDVLASFPVMHCFLFHESEQSWKQGYFNSTAQKSELGVSSFGISVTTMEEVFIKVGEGSVKKMEDRYDYNGRFHSWLGIHFLLVHGICRYRCKTDVLESADTETVRLGRKLSSVKALPLNYCYSIENQ